ncbi:MAG: type VI secretion system lipoprotein TssJ [Candidatus Accumulibacter sp.]|jgi:type VI secretion system VasD/TssJ family lipoprotein|nr:type VI secretion system lipoprotein TssJ [Accumulibacter sp.]
MRPARFVFAFAFFLALAACGGAGKKAFEMPPPTPSADPSGVVWQTEPKGLRISIEAAPDLNAQDGEPLALSLCVYQLDKTAKFDDLAQSEDGLNLLQDCTISAADAVAAQRFWLQPGQTRVVEIDRAAGAKSLALAAGYAHLAPSLSTARFSYLLHSEKEGYIPGFRKTVYSAARMDIVIRLSASEVSVNGVEREPQ